jgi:hypothetical protein
MANRILGAFLASAMMILTNAAVASEKTDVMATVRQVLKAANANHTPALAPLMAEEGVVIDEFAPYRWQGMPGWLGALREYDAQNRVTGAKSTLRRFGRVFTADGQAYAVAEVDYAYRERGKPRLEHGTEVYGLDKAAGHWRVHSFAWFSAGGIDEGADASAITALVQNAMAEVTAGRPDPTAPDWRGVIDEFAAFHWSGPSTASDWLADFAKTGATGAAVRLARPIHLSVNGDTGYAVFPAAITLTAGKTATDETGQFAFALEKSGGNWQVAGWAWARK